MAKTEYSRPHDHDKSGNKDTQKHVDKICPNI